MKRYFQVYPEVAGNIADSDFLDREARPPKVLKLIYKLDGWLGDDILSSIGTFIITRRLKESIEQEGLTGVVFDKVEVIVSGQFVQLYGNKHLPTFFWLKITGVIENDDFARSPAHRLIVSQRALDVLQRFQLMHVEVEEYSA